MTASSSNVSFVLHDVARLLRKRFEQRSRLSGLTRAQWQVLAYLECNEGVNQAGLAELMEIMPITLARLLDKMQERGLIERRQHPTDRRAWLLYLAPKAHPLLEVMRRMGQKTRNEALEGLSQEEQARLFKTLTQVKTNLLAACAMPVADPEKIHG